MSAASTRVVGRFLAQLVRFAGEHPDERVEPEEGRRDPGEQQLDPVEPGDVRQLMGDDRLGFADASTARLLSRMTGRISPQLIGRQGRRW